MFLFIFFLKNYLHGLQTDNFVPKLFSQESLVWAGILFILFFEEGAELPIGLVKSSIFSRRKPTKSP